MNRLTIEQERDALYNAARRVGLDAHITYMERKGDAHTCAEKLPFSYQGVTIEKLTFDWGKLTGEDHLAIENELLLRGKTLVTPEFTGEFLCGMATRACTDRNGDGFRILNMEVLKAMPMRDFQTICKRARAFLLRAGS